MFGLSSGFGGTGFNFGSSGSTFGAASTGFNFGGGGGGGGFSLGSGSSGFGASTGFAFGASSGFSSNTSSFGVSMGSFNSPSPTSGTGGVTYQASADKDLKNGRVVSNLQLVHICCMPEFQDKPLALLRYQDYQAAGQAPGISATPAPQTQSFSTGFSFGSPAPAASTGFGFGASTGFSMGGGASTGFGFGSFASSASASTGFSFGSSSGFGFGATATSGFGSSSSGFGATSSTGFGFGSSTTFGSPSTASTGFAFGSSFASPAPAASTGFGFGAASSGFASTGFSFASSSSSGFGTTAASSGFGFGASTGFGSVASTGFGFGAPATTGFSFSSGASTGFGFGSSSSTPASTGFSFGATTTTPSTGFNFGSGTTSSTWGSTGFNFGSTASTGFSLGTTFGSASTPMGAPAKLEPPKEAYGKMPKTKYEINVKHTPAKTAQVKQPSSTGAMVRHYSRFNRLTPRSEKSRSQLDFVPSEAERNLKVAGDFLVTQPRMKKLVVENNPSLVSPLFDREARRKLMTGGEGWGDPGTPYVAKTVASKPAIPPQPKFDMSSPDKHLHDSISGLKHPTPQRPKPNKDYQSYFEAHVDLRKSSFTDLKVAVPKCTSPGVYTIPDHSTFERLTEDELKSIDSFVIGKKGIGSIEFLTPVDVRGLDLDAIVQFAPREIVVYPDEQTKPHVGYGLNTPAIVTIEGCYALDPKTNRITTEPEAVGRLVAKLKRKCERYQSRFVGFKPEKGEWKFEVDSF